MVEWWRDTESSAWKFIGIFERMGLLCIFLDEEWANTWNASLEISKIVNTDQNHDRITLKQTFLRYLVNCGMLALLGMPLFLIYADSKKLAVNDILSKTKLEKI